jgi:hypothetical protein
MKKLKNLILACLVPLLAQLVFVQTSQAAEQTVLPSDMASNLPSAAPVGKGRLIYFGFDVYDAKLWVAPDFKSSTFGSHKIALELQYLRNFTAQAISKSSLKEMQAIEPVPEQKAAIWINKLQEALPNIKKSDRLMGIYDPSTGVTFWLNGKRISEIRDTEFASQFFAIWLSPKTSQPKLRLSLLGSGN